MLDPCRSWHPCRVLRTGRVTPHPGGWVGGRGTNLQDMYGWDLPLHHLFFYWKWKDSNVLFVYRGVLFALPQLKSWPSSLHFGLRHRLGCKTELMVFAWRFVLSRSCCGGFQGLHWGIWFHWYRLWVMFKRIDCWNATNAKIQYACNHVNDIYYIYALHTHTHHFSFSEFIFHLSCQCITYRYECYLLPIRWLYYGTFGTLPAEFHQQDINRLFGCDMIWCDKEMIMYTVWFPFHWSLSAVALGILIISPAVREGWNRHHS